MRIGAILLFAILVSSVYTTSAFAQSTKAQIVVNSITQNTPVIVANSPNNEFLVGVSNTGNAPGTKKITLVMYQNYGSDNESTHACTSGGAYEASVTLNPGEFVGIAWQCTMYGPGTYQVKSLGKTLNFEVSDTQGKLYVSKVTVDPINPKLGDNAVFTVTVKNFDAIHGSKNISYKLIFYSTPPFTASFGSKSITLGPEGSTTFTVDAVFSSSDPWRFYADDYVYDPIVEEAKQQLQKDIEEDKTEEEKQADEDSKQLQKDVEEQKKTEQEEKTDDTDEIEQEEEQVTGSKLVVTDVIITPRKNLKPNDMVTITAVVKNVGDAEGTKSIVPVINAPVAGKSAMVDAQSVTVKPGKEKTLTWQIPILVSGVYDVFVDGKGDSFQVKSATQDAKKPTDTTDKEKFDIRDVGSFSDTLKKLAERYSKGQVDSSGKKPFDIDDAADSDSDKKKFDIDDAADFDTYDGESEPFEDGVLSSEDLDRIKNVSDMQVIDDLESIRDKILSVDFGSVVGPSDDQTKIKTISEKYDAANDKLRIAIEKRESIADLKQKLEKQKEKDEELRNQYHSDFNRYQKIYKENTHANQSKEEKLRILGAEEDMLESQERWESSGQEIHDLEKKIRELESDADKLYDDAMKDLDSISDELDKANQSEPNYEDKNQKPFVTDDLKKETYQDATRSIGDIMRVTEEYEKNRDALRKQDTLKQIIDEKANQQLNNDVYDTYFGDKPISSTFYPGDLESLSSVGPRVEHQNAIWSVLEDSSTLQKHKTKALQALEQKSESNIEQISTQTELVGKLQDASYFGTIPSQANTDNVATLSIGAMSQSGFDGVLSADIPIKPIFDDGKTAKYSVLGGNLAIVDPSSRQIEDVLSIAFGKGRIDQSGKMTFVINAVDDIGRHQTITLGSNQGDSTVMISGGSEFALTSMAISNTMPLDDVSDKTVQDAMSRQVVDEFEQYLVYDVSSKEPSVVEWRKLHEAAKKAEEQKQKAWNDLQKAGDDFDKAKDPKIREELNNLEKEIEKAEKEKHEAFEEQKKAFKDARLEKSDLDKQKEKQAYEEHMKTDSTDAYKKWNALYYDIDSASDEAKAKFKEASEKWDRSFDKVNDLEKKRNQKILELRDSAGKDLEEKANDAFRKWSEADKTSSDLNNKAKDAWKKLDEAAKSKGLR